MIFARKLYQSLENDFVGKSTMWVACARRCVPVVPTGLFFFVLLGASRLEAAPLTKVSGPELRKKLVVSTKPVVMNFWTTWCEPCMEEIPMLVRERKKLSSEIDFFLVSLDAKSQLSRVQKFLKSQSVDFETYIKTGSDDDFISAVLPQWAGAVPVTVFLAPRGKIVKLHQGIISSKEFNEYVKKIK